MNEINKLSKTLPDTVGMFEVSVTGDLTKKNFSGSFSCHIPTRKDQCMIDKHRAFLNGPLVDQLDTETLNFHHKVAYLRYTINHDTAPQWWKDNDYGYSMYDENVVAAVYDMTLKFERDWLRQVWGDEAVDALEQKNGTESDRAR